MSVRGSDLVVLIGPNNAGKSAALREISQHVREQTDGLVVKSLTTHREGDEEEFVRWLLEVASLMPPGRENQVVGWNADMVFDNAKNHWRQDEEGAKFANLTAFLILLVNAETRLGLAGSVESFDPHSNVPRLPLQRLLADPAAEVRLSIGVESAYGEPVCINRAGGSTLHLLLGKAASEARLDNKTYMDEIAAFPLVSEQGDGVRSFIGLLLALEAAPYPIVLVDEPEAFLHPPQAREIGRQLASGSGTQRFVATHDSNVLLGLLERAENPLIVRLRREGDKNIPAVLGQEQVKELWNDPSFRYSRLLDGLFHRGAVICESDGDATLYSAALDAELEEGGGPASDLLFTQCGGKHKMAAAIDALRSMGVPVASIVDLDVLRQEEVIEGIVTALEGTWSDYAGAWNVVRAAIESLAIEAAPVGDVADGIEEVLGDDRTARLDETQSRRIREITKRVDGWKRIKQRGGVAAVRHGEARAAIDDLLQRLRGIGLFLVPVGELEGWGPTLGGHGTEFVDKALTEGTHRTNAELRSFVYAASEFLAS